MVQSEAPSQGYAEVGTGRGGTIIEHDEALETWLRTEGVAAYDELKADPSRGRTPEQVRQRLTDERKRAERDKKSDGQA